MSMSEKQKKEIFIDNEKCRNCGLCLWVCPKSVFEKKDKKIIAAYPEKCIGCRLCELNCCGALDLKLGHNKKEKKRSDILVPKQPRGGWKEIETKMAGKYFLSGNEAIVKAAIIAGCGYFAGYPITPANEILTEFAKERSKNLIVRQSEDEIAALQMVLGAVWSGKKGMTATSGPGFSLMQESISWASMTETPCVIVDVQRSGPSTGQPTKPAAMDLREGRWGSHGGTSLIALYPDSVQEVIDLIIASFNLAEIYRVPVILFSDAYLAHLKEKIEIPEKIKIFERIYIPGAPAFGPTADLKTPSMPKFGDIANLSITGSTHYPNGSRSTTDADVQENLILYLRDKIVKNREEIFKLAFPEMLRLDDAEIVVVAFGTAARSAKWAIAKAREQGIKIGLLRPRIIFPFCSNLVEEISKREQTKFFLVPEMSQGQMNYVVREKVAKPVISYARPNGKMLDPKELLKFIISLKDKEVVDD